jgi:ribonuclease R
MLPERLSNGLCSLNPNVERLTLTAQLTFNNDGVMVEKSFYKSIIRSDYRLTYKKVQAIFDGDCSLKEEYSAVVPMLECARGLMRKMLALREKKGTVDLGVEECRIYFENGELMVEKREGIESERLIEQFMIAANVAVAEFIYYAELPLIYRVHGKPDGDKLLTLKAFLKACGLKAPQKLEFPMDFQKILSSLNGLPLKGVVSDVMLRSMQKAVYSPQNQGHFGLNEKCYCHFTSPIRRYPDLVVHRILKAVLEGRVGELLEKYESKIDEIAMNTSDCERKADLIERDVDDIYVCKFMENFIGDFFEVIVSGVTSFGVFVRLKNAVEGLIRLEHLPKGRYEFFEESFTLKSNKLSFKLGDSLIVKLVATDSSVGRIYFELIKKL